MTLLALIVLIAAVAIWVLLPLASSPRADPLAVPDEAAELEARREQLLLALQDLDFEMQTGKLSAEDHATLRARLQAEAVEVMRLLEESQPQETSSSSARSSAAS